MDSLEVAMLPELVEAPLTGRTAVVIDVLRATTTVTWALRNGAREILPCASIDEARRKASGSDPQRLLGGERGGVAIDGFDLGNSPSDYAAEAVGGRSIAFTTTNGTRAMLASREADEVLLAAFSNVSAVVSALRAVPQVTVVCSGTDGAVTLEDVLLAGSIVDACSKSAAEVTLNDQARLAVMAWRQVDPVGGLEQSLRASQGGRNLVKLGRDDDVHFAAQVDCCDLVGRFEPTLGVITRFE